MDSRRLFLILLLGVTLSGFVPQLGAHGAPVADDRPCRSGVLASLRAKWERMRSAPSRASRSFADYMHEVRDTRGVALLVTGKKVLFWLPRQQDRYWTDVWKSRGRRLILSERPEPLDRFNWMYLLDPVLAPVTIPLELAKSRYNLSIPATIGATVAINLTWNQIAGYSNKKRSGIPGASYVRDLAEKNLLVPRHFYDKAIVMPQNQTAAEILEKHRANLVTWENDTSGSLVLPRITQLLNLGILKDQAEKLALNEIAHRVFGHDFCQPAVDPECRKVPEDFESGLMDKLASALLEDPRFKNKSPEQIRALMLTFLPVVPISAGDFMGSRRPISDAELLGAVFGAIPGNPAVADLRRASIGLSPADAIVLARGSARYPKAIQEKQKQWNAQATDGSSPEFTRRIDLPWLKDFEVPWPPAKDGKPQQRLKSELDLWRILWTDPRFVDLKTQYQSDSAQGDTATLAELIDRMVQLSKP